MKSLVLSSFDMTYLPTIGFFLFLAVYLGALLWTFRKFGKKHYQEIAKSALNEGQIYER